METQLKYNGNTVETQWKHNGNTMETQWEYNGNWKLLRQFRLIFFLLIIFLLTVNVSASNLENIFCYPNPFSPYTGEGKLNIQYQLTKDAGIKITIYNLIGDVVYTKTYEKGISDISKAGQGSYEIEWDGKNNDGRYVADGGYILQIKADDGSNIVVKYIKIKVRKDR